MQATTPEPLQRAAARLRGRHMALKRASASFERVAEDPDLVRDALMEMRRAEGRLLEAEQAKIELQLTRLQGEDE